MLPRLARLCLLSSCFGLLDARQIPAAEDIHNKESCSIVYPAGADVRETLAAREVRRYWYLRTGRLCPLRQATALPPEGDLIVVANRDRPVVGALGVEAGLRARIERLRPQQYLLKMLRRGDRRLVLIVGGVGAPGPDGSRSPSLDGVGTLYGAYRFAEHLGVRFFLHGDVIPDRRIAPAIPELDETGKPLFELRGVNPWGSHAEGFDLWNADQYKAIFAQLAKMRMNFLGVHCYGEGHPNAEPTVWVGLPGDFDAAGRVSLSYPADYFNTARGRWGYRPKKTGDYSFGGRLLFECDDWGPDVMRGHCPAPKTPQACNEVFNRTGRLLREAFGLARLLGVKTCVGTEAPMTMPKVVRDKLRSSGKDPADPAAVREVYEGIFTRIIKTHPLDFYWIWTPEGWTWRGNSNQQTAATVADIKLALVAKKNVQAPFALATCGWVLGPQDDRAAFDRLLPKEIAISAISRNVGHDPVDPALARIKRRQKWAIPWLEDDPALSSPQLWVGRTRRDAADALAYGCTGLMGLHWRTRILGPNVSALARAAWDQSPWNPQGGKLRSFSGLPGPPADPPSATPTARGQPRGLPADDFYADWALAMFGPEVADRAAAIFRRIDGRLPRTSDWVGGAGGIKPDGRPWDRVAEEFAFLDHLEKLRPDVDGAGNLERFDYWLSTLRYMRAQARVRCVWAELIAAIKKVETEADTAVRARLAAEVALPVYRQLIARVGEAYTHQLSAASTPGGIATLINWEQHIYPELVDKPGRQLAQALVGPLPADARAGKAYQGKPRLIVPTVRSCLLSGEVMKLRVIILSAGRPREAVLCWRPLGSGPFRRISLEHVARGVYTVAFPPAREGIDLEYYLEAIPETGPMLRRPATAPVMNQTLVVIPAAQ